MKQEITRTDATTTVKVLKDELIRFKQERGWGKYHSPRNLAVSIAIEAAELMEHFQWGNEDIKKNIPDIADELADVLSYVLDFADSLDIDVTTAFFNKRARVEKKYPVALFNPKTENRDVYDTVKKAYRKNARTETRES